MYCEMARVLHLGRITIAQQKLLAQENLSNTCHLLPKILIVQGAKIMAAKDLGQDSGQDLAYWGPRILSKNFLLGILDLG